MDLVSAPAPLQLELRKFVAPEIVFGRDARRLAGQYAKNLGARQVMLVTDPGVMAAGWTSDVVSSLSAAGVGAVVFSGVSPNPRAGEVMAGAALYRFAGCDAIVSVGGGSPTDCAKGIGVVVSNGGHILDFEGVDRVAVPGPPLICVPTTGVAADISQFAIITNSEERYKAAIISKAVVPDVSLVDPLTLTTLPSYIAACTTFDALVHAIEAYASNASSSLTDLHALSAVHLLFPNIARSLRDPTNVELRAELMLGSLEAGLAFSNASLGAVHAMAHSLGGMSDLPHGECNALLLDRVVEFNLPAAGERYEKIGEAMGLNTQGMTHREKQAALVAAVSELRAEANITATLGERGVRLGDVPELAAHAIQDPCVVTNPRRPNQRDLEVIYEEAL